MGEVHRRWPDLDSLGCYGVRPVRGGGPLSSHSYGAAIDISYPPDFDPTVAELVCPFLVARSEELGVQAVHDYRRSRIWRAGRTALDEEACTAWWKAQRPSSITGMGQSWANHLHVEVSADRWGDMTPMSRRWSEA